MVLAARLAEQQCLIVWQTVDAEGHKIITRVEC
jgi:hypothetical protein